MVLTHVMSFTVTVKNRKCAWESHVFTFISVQEPRATGERITHFHSIYRPGWLGLWRSAFVCVGWQVTLCDPIRQVTLRSFVMGFPLRAVLGFNLFYLSRAVFIGVNGLCMTLYKQSIVTLALSCLDSEILQVFCSAQPLFHIPP